MSRFVYLCSLTLTCVYITLHSFTLLGGQAFAADVVIDANGVRHGTGLRKDQERQPALYFNPHVITGILPEEYDLRALGLVAPIKDQKNCGACYSFAITESLEDAILHAGGDLVDLSTQQIVSCAKDAYGCGGGFMSTADYILNPGLALAKDYPYTATSSRCKNPLPHIAAKAASYSFIGASNRAPTTDELKQAIYTYGSIFVTVSAGGSDWDGRKVMTRCSNRSTNHMILIVGWTRDGKWIIKNSWSKNWGEDGFAYMPYKCDNVANEKQGAAFTVFADNPCTPPQIKLPAQINIALGTEVMLGVRSEPGVSYSWSGGPVDGSGSMVYAKPTVDTEYTLTAETRCGTGESSVLVHVLPAF